MRRLLMLALPTAALACGSSPEPRGEELAAIPVRVATPTLTRAEPPVLLTGTLGAKEEVPLGFKLGGVVDRVVADAGDRVRAGQLLAALSLTEIESQVAAAREGRDKAKRDLARAEVLYRDSVVTIAQLEDARSGLEVAEAQLRAAEFNRQYAEIRAPADGEVLRRQVEPGQLVGPGTPVFVLRSADKGLVLRAAAADRDVVRLREGMSAAIAFDAFASDSFVGRVARLGVAANPMTGTYEVEIEVNPAGRRLVSGLIGRARLHPERSSPVLTVPTEALLEIDGGAATLFSLDPSDANRVRRHTVQVLWIDGGAAAVAGAIDSSARVITAGVTRIGEASRVQVVERVP